MTLSTQNLFCVLAIMFTASVFASANAEAQQGTFVQPSVGNGQNENPLYFGLNAQLVNGFGGAALRVVSITPGSPACRAGLEVGDEILTVNGQGFNYARDSFEAVAMMNRFCLSTPVGGGPAPAAEAFTRVNTCPAPQPQPIASMVVRNVRNGQNVSVTMHPTIRGYTPAPAAPAAPAYAQ
jgi:membrane-associated protease RseP (regulator of RpoE activity)